MCFIYKLYIINKLYIILLLYFANRKECRKYF